MTDTSPSFEDLADQFANFVIDKPSRRKDIPLPKPPRAGERSKMSPAQKRRRDRNSIRHHQRALMFPADPLTNKRPKRMSPQQLAPKDVPKHEGTSLRTCVENPAEPNEYLYLYMTNTYESGRAYRWMQTDGSFTPKVFDSVYDAVLAVYKAGYLDASW